ncbi:MAG: hypothetical protein LUP99_00920 [Methanomicrobiales archaeon]|nr:hypothetical protein [Methanomicrobiales archaeon]
MNLLAEATGKLRLLLEGSGCEDGIVTLRRNPDTPRCQYERGVCIEAHFGGGYGQVMTNFPIQATTRISFMYGSTLQSAEERTAALAILNAAGGFLCLARKLHACRAEEYEPCLMGLHEVTGALRVACIGSSPVISHEFATQLVEDPELADIILVVANGAIAESTTSLIDHYHGKKRMIFLGPSFPGFCSLINSEHWCPYGR